MVVGLRGIDATLNTAGQAAPRLWRGVILPGCGHWTQQERPDEVTGQLLEFLAQLPENPVIRPRAARRHRFEAAWPPSSSSLPSLPGSCVAKLSDNSPPSRSGSTCTALRARPRHCLSLLMQRSTALRCLYVSTSNVGVRPPARPRRRRWPIWSAGCGMTDRMPRRRRCPRIAREEYERSARRVCGRVLGLPRLARGTRMPAMIASKAGASPAWAAVTWRVRGRARPSLVRWTSVLRPPRERPSACSSGSERSAAPRSGRMLVCPAHGGVHRHRPTHLTFGSAAARTAVRMRFQVPSTAHLISHSRAVRNGPSSAGRSRHGQQVRYFHAMASKSPAVVCPPPSADRIGQHQRLDPGPHCMSDHQPDRHIRSTGQPIKETRSTPCTRAASSTPT